MHDRDNIFIAVTALREDFRHVLKVGDRIQIGGGLLAAKPAVEVAADRGMLAVPGELANMIDVVSHMGNGYAFIVTGAARPAGTEHPVVERDADHSLTCDDGMELFVIKLTLVG